jgi:hypothetical protein
MSSRLSSFIEQFFVRSILAAWRPPVGGVGRGPITALVPLPGAALQPVLLNEANFPLKPNKPDRMATAKRTRFETTLYWLFPDRA